MSNDIFGDERLRKEEEKEQGYINFLEEATSSKFNLTGGKPLKYDKSEIGPMKGMDYRGVPVGGDKVRNYEEKDGPIHKGEVFNDLDDLLKKVTDDSYDDVKGDAGVKQGSKKLGEEFYSDESPLSVLDMVDEDIDYEDDDFELTENEIITTFDDEEVEVLNRLIKEMNSIDEATDYDEEEGDVPGEQDTGPDEYSDDKKGKKKVEDEKDEDDEEILDLDDDEDESDED